jgi:integrase
MPPKKRGPRPGSRYKRANEARVLAPVAERKNGVKTGFWLGRYIDCDGKRRQAARCRRKGDASKAAHDKVYELNSSASQPATDITLAEWNEVWPKRFRLSERTVRTNQHRVRHYILPHLPLDGEIPIGEIARAMLHDVQTALLEQGLSKSTIDGAFSSLSAVLGYALKEERIESNPAYGLHVDLDDPLLEPLRQRRERRYIRPEELARFYVHVPKQHRAVCLAPVATGCRTQELFALERADRSASDQLILTHQRAHRYGGDPDAPGVLIPGLKGKKGVRNKTKEERGRWTLFPRFLARVSPPRAHRLMFPTRTGKVWSQRNFYRDVWEPAAELAGTNFTLYDLRHTFCSELVTSGIPTVEVSAYVGHEIRLPDEIDNTTTRTYLHATGAYREQALEALEQYFARMLAATKQSRVAGAM